MERQDFVTIVLPDDPRLRPGASRRRTITGSHAWKRSRFTPRSVTKNHQHHLLTTGNLAYDGYFDGQGA